MSKARLGVVMFILSEVNFFLLLIVAYAFYHTYPGPGPTAATSLDVPRTALFSVLLFSSSATMWMAGRCYQREGQRGTAGWLILTILLGGAFLIGQVIEYAELYSHGVTISRNMFGTTFFTLTGFHGIHVFVGLTAIAIVAWLVLLGEMKDKESHVQAFEAVSLYWHFVDAVWVVIFTLVYLWAFL
jgi:heme/copper-type cytochrome/quinol oxidase subunit 3